MPSPILGLHKMTQVGNPKDSIAVPRAGAGVEVESGTLTSQGALFPSPISIRSRPPFLCAPTIFSQDNMNSFADVSLRPCQPSK